MPSFIHLFMIFFTLWFLNSTSTTQGSPNPQTPTSFTWPLAGRILWLWHWLGKLPLTPPQVPPGQLSIMLCSAYKKQAREERHTSGWRQLGSCVFVHACWCTCVGSCWCAWADLVDTQSDQQQKPHTHPKAEELPLPSPPPPLSPSNALPRPPHPSPLHSPWHPTPLNPVSPTPLNPVSPTPLNPVSPTPDPPHTHPCPPTPRVPSPPHTHTWQPCH